MQTFATTFTKKKKEIIKKNCTLFSLYNIFFTIIEDNINKLQSFQGITHNFSKNRIVRNSLKFLILVKQFIQ